MVSVLVADVRGCERRRRTYNHMKAVSEVFVYAAFGGKHRETAVTRSEVVESAALSPTFDDG